MGIQTMRARPSRRLPPRGRIDLPERIRYLLTDRLGRGIGQAHMSQMRQGRRSADFSGRLGLAHRPDVADADQLFQGMPTDSPVSAVQSQSATRERRTDQRSRARYVAFAEWVCFADVISASRERDDV
jgi:hypothetical protein